jgi:hypothetical protein
MTITFQLQADELDQSIIKSIKQAYKGRSIEIIVSEQETNKEDVLLERIKNIREDVNTVSFTQEDFFKTYRKKATHASDKI